MGFLDWSASLGRYTVATRSDTCSHVSMRVRIDGTSAMYIVILYADRPSASTIVSMLTASSKSVLPPGSMVSILGVCSTELFGSSSTDILFIAFAVARVNAEIGSVIL